MKIMIYRTSSPRPRRFLLKVVVGAALASTAIACSDATLTGSVRDPDAGDEDLGDATSLPDGKVVGVIANWDAETESDSASLDGAPGVLADAQPDVDASSPVGVVADSGSQ